MTKWEMKRLEVVREYEISEAPDLQDSTSKRRRVIRPRRVKVYQVYGTNLVRGAVIEGRQVRRDGELGQSQQILAGVSTKSWGYSAEPPLWLDKILVDESLEWTDG